MASLRQFDCGNDVWVGEAAACSPAFWARTIHIYKGENITARQSCRTVLDATGHGFGLSWCEGEGLGLMSATPDAIAAYAAVPGQLLVHCLAGHCRSPTVALIALVARGVDVFEAIKRVSEGSYRGCGLMPAWYWQTLIEVARWAEERR